MSCFGTTPTKISPWPLMAGTYSNSSKNNLSEDSIEVICSENSAEVSSATSNTEEGPEKNIVEYTRETEIRKAKQLTKINDSSEEPARLRGEGLSESEDKVKKFLEDLHNHKDSQKTKRDLLEDFIRKNASDQFKKAMEKIEKKEVHRLKDEKLKKWASIGLSGTVSQWVSFAAATEAALLTGEPWVFTILASVLNEIVSDKTAALIRRSTFVTEDTKNLYRKQRLIARAFGDLIRYCNGLKLQEKYRTNNPAFEGQKFTAWNALMHDTDWFVEPMMHNILNRGVPFLWFTGTYLVRDHLLKTVFNGASGWEMFLIRLAAGGIAGGLTALTSQFITSCNKGVKEVVGHSTSYWRAREEYLRSLKIDIKDRLDEAEKMENASEKNKITHMLLDLNIKINREISVAELRGSKLTSFGGEIAASFHKHRTEDSLDPEAPGSRSQTVFNITGKFLSLIVFTYLLAESQKSALGKNSLSPHEPLNFIALPLTLIISGFMWKDDLQIFPRLGYAAAKGLYDSTIGREKYMEKYEERSSQQLTDVVTEMPKILPDQDKESTYSASGGDYSRNQQQFNRSSAQNDSQEENNIPPTKYKHQTKEKTDQTTGSLTDTKGKTDGTVSRKNTEDETDDENEGVSMNAGSSSEKESHTSAHPSGGSSDDESSEYSSSDAQVTPPKRRHN